MRWIWILVFGVGCLGSPVGNQPPPSVPAPSASAPEPPPETFPETFADFFAAFQHKTCALAIDGCANITSILRCGNENWLPPCVDYDAEAGALCLERPAVCEPDGRIISAPICDVVCLDAELAELGAFRSEVCQRMLACDEALAQATSNYTQAFQGELDSDYGLGGSCFEYDVAACEETCRLTLETFAQLDVSLLSGGELDQLPSECL